MSNTMNDVTILGQLDEGLTPEEDKAAREYIEDELYECGNPLGIFVVMDSKYLGECMFCSTQFKPGELRGWACWDDGDEHAHPAATDCSVIVCLDREACRLKQAVKSEEPRGTTDR